MMDTHTTATSLVKIDINGKKEKKKEIPGPRTVVQELVEKQEPSGSNKLKTRPFRFRSAQEGIGMKKHISKWNKTNSVHLCNHLSSKAPSTQGGGQARILPK